MASWTTMRVTVWEPFYDSDDVPWVDGIIELTEDEAKDLTERLDRLSAEDIISHYELYAHEVPAPVTVEGIFNMIAGVDGVDPQLRALWEGVDTPVA